MSDYTMTIDGKAESAKATFGVINPATEDIFARPPECTKEQLEAAFQSAQAAFKPWNRDEAKRRQTLLDIGEAIKSRGGEIAPLLTQEQGKPVDKAMMEVIGASIWFQYTASLQIPVEVIADTPQNRTEVRRRALGVVAAITPWNFPLMLAVWKIAPALLAGNTVVIKPSPYTPLTTLKLGEILRSVVPPGVVNVVSGGNELGGWMTAHPIPRKVSFTGSVATGKKVNIAAAPDLKRVTLELGGNDAAILLGDIDVKSTAQKVFWGAFENSGQICSAIKRVYVPENLYSSVVAELQEIAKTVKVGNGLEAGTQLGPLNNKMQYDRVNELVADAKQHGAKIVTGGQKLSNKGYFIAPTIVSEISDGTRLVDEEQFGPALPVIPYRNVEDAVERANATHYGLSGSVWSANPEKAAEVARQLDTGTAWVNQHLAIAPNLPFGGAKWSGIGVENGPWGLLGFTELQVVNIAKT
ncbi:MAG TPA: aldehyde dehydrogenase family protein [Myxococcota bacterium]|nr:aldehyde dehydrogenase family protein [Myxococcota bacterium]